jgi:hypothetical protein
MVFNFKKIFFILTLFIICSSLFGVEKSNPIANKKTVSFDFLSGNQKNDLNEIKESYTYTGFQSQFFRTGLYMVGFGGACAILGGALFGLSYLVKWYLANSIGWTYENVISNIFILESVFNIHSYYATVAIAFWITGIVLMGISAIIIPGIILMVIDRVMSAKRVKPLKEAVGFAIQF